MHFVLVMVTVLLCYATAAIDIAIGSKQWIKVTVIFGSTRNSTNIEHFYLTRLSYHDVFGVSSRAISYRRGVFLIGVEILS